MMTDKDLFLAAVQDWEADQQYEDLIVDYNVETDDGEPYVIAHDENHTYMLKMDPEGNIYIV